MFTFLAHEHLLHELVVTVITNGLHMSVVLWVNQPTVVQAYLQKVKHYALTCELELSNTCNKGKPPECLFLLL